MSPGSDQRSLTFLANTVGKMTGNSNVLKYVTFVGANPAASSLRRS